MRMRTWVCLSLALTGCGSSSLGLPGGAVVEDLSDADAEQLCVDVTQRTIDEASASLDTIFCTTFGITAALLAGSDLPPAVQRAACEVSVEECLMAELPTVDPEESCRGATALVGCTATVSELEACLDEQIDALRDQASSISCAVFDDPSFDGTIDDPPDPPSCASLPDACFDDGE